MYSTSIGDLFKFNGASVAKIKKGPTQLGRALVLEWIERWPPHLYASYPEALWALFSPTATKFIPMKGNMIYS